MVFQATSGVKYFIKFQATNLHYKGYTTTWLGTTWVNEMDFVVNHASGAGLIAQPIDLQSNALSLCYGCPLDPRMIGLVHKTTKPLCYLTLTSSGSPGISSLHPSASVRWKCSLLSLYVAITSIICLMTDAEKKFRLTSSMRPL